MVPSVVFSEESCRSALDCSANEPRTVRSVSLYPGFAFTVRDRLEIVSPYLDKVNVHLDALIIRFGSQEVNFPLYNDLET